MSRHWKEPSPVLVTNDERGDWVMTRQIVLCTTAPAGGSILRLRSGLTANSPMTPSQLRARLFSLGEEDL